MDINPHSISTVISIDDTVITTQTSEEWKATQGWGRRVWGVKGKVTDRLDSHVLCYQVQHEDGTIGYYEPTELQHVTI
jgi:hypothetical protein